MGTAGRRADPFAGIAPLIAAVSSEPLPPVLLLTGDDEWILAEAAKRVAAAFRAKFPEGEVAEHEGNAGAGEAVADAATIALFSTNRLVVLEATELFRGKKLSADEVDALLDDAAEAGLGAAPGAPQEPAALGRLSRRARALLALPRADADEPLEERVRRALGRVKRGGRSAEMAALLDLSEEDPEAAESGADRVAAYSARAAAGDNTLLVRALSPDADHPALAAVRRAAVKADLSAPSDDARRDRLAALGLDRALERGMLVEGEVFDLLTERGRLSARTFLIELDRLMDAAPAKKVTAEAAARLVANEKKEYGSDFVDAFTGRRPVEALKILERLLASDGFTAFRPYGEQSAAAKKGPRGEAAFFPILGLLAGEVRRMLGLRACAEERGVPARRTDYRTFNDRILPALKAARPGKAPLALEGHPFAMHKAWCAAADWSVPELATALSGIERIDRGVKGGAGTGPELLESLLLSAAAPRTPARRA